MKRLIASVLTLSFLTTSALSADVSSSSDLQETVAPDTQANDGLADSPATTPSAEGVAEVGTQEDLAAEAKVVGKASEEATRSATKERWQNIALAAGAITVATVALILVSNNKGHRSSTSGN